MDLGKVVVVARKLVRISRGLPSNTEKKKAGGVLTLALDGMSDRHVIEVGKIASEKGDKYTRLSQEKAFRLYADWLRNPRQTVSSWQTRQPEMDRWGGAVLFRPAGSCNIISFSGLTELCDEALSLLVGYKLGFPEEAGWAKRFTDISKNEAFYEMWREFNKDLL